MEIRKKNVLVTGGAGFIGSHLVDALIKHKAKNITVIDNLFLGKMSNLREAKKKFPKLKIFKTSLCDYCSTEKIIKKQKIDVVFNLAVIPLPVSLIKPELVFDENVMMTKNLCLIARKGLFETLIQFSSSEVYGTTIYEPMNEVHPLNPHTPYASSKVATDMLVYSYYKTFGIDMCIIRPFNNYGPRQNEGNYAGIIPITIKRLLNREHPIIFGDGLQTRDFIYVEDTANATIAAYENKSTRGKIINLASGTEITMKHLVEKIIKYSHIKRKILYKKKRTGDLRRLVGDIKIAKKLINFKQSINFDKGLKETIKWYKKQLSR